MFNFKTGKNGKHWMALSALVLGMLSHAAYAQDDPAASSDAAVVQPAAAPQVNIRPQLNAAAVPQPGAQPQIVPKPPEINATSYILMDAATGTVLVEKNADQALPPASLTKIMTTYVADMELSAGNISLDDQVPVSIKAWRTDGSKMFIQEGTTVRLEDLMRGIIIQSGNDASIALAEHIAGSEDAFADLMNQHARQLGMTNSYFLNSSGLPDADHVMSARDLATLARTLITHFPEQYKIYSEREFTYNNIRQPNRNSLLFTDPNVDGMKTGFTDEAGYCLVASSLREGMRLITVVLGAESTNARAVETQKLLTFGFRFFENHQLFTENQVLGTSKIWSGAADSIEIGIQNALSVTLPRGQVEGLQTVLELDETIKAPITIGQELGKVRVSLGEQVFYDGPVVAMQDVEQGSWIKRLMDWLHLFFLSLFG